jgi:DNA invertase Pin-like site-specific DNA recombinase
MVTDDLSHLLINKINNKVYVGQTWLPLKNRMGDAREQDILQAYKDGQIIANIVSIFNTGRATIYRILKRNNISSKRAYNDWQGKEHTEETKKKMAEARIKYWANKELKDIS